MIIHLVIHFSLSYLGVIWPWILIAHCFFLLPNIRFFQGWDRISPKYHGDDEVDVTLRMSRGSSREDDSKQ
jgi:hypothetical protein